MSNHKNPALAIIDTEIKALQSLHKIINNDFSKAIKKILNINGRVVLSGIGKSGFVANKISATLASTGTPAFFVNPNEASHGDLGMITKDDLVILLSNSGETKELKDIIYYCKNLGIPLFAMVRNSKSILVRNSDIAFVLDAVEEGNKVNAPMASTTMMLALGDALANSLIEARNFSNENYGVFHPGGRLGEQFVKVADLMRVGKTLPIVDDKTKMKEVLLEITSKSFGCCAVVDQSERIIGIITDGDLRRAFNEDFFALSADEIMTKEPILIDHKNLVSGAISLMQEKKITSVFVVDKRKDDKKIIGILHIHDCLKG